MSSVVKIKETRIPNLSGTARAAVSSDQSKNNNVNQDQPVQQPIIGYHKDDAGHWVAQLSCGHNQHVRHDPPWTIREWVTTQAGRDAMLGHPLNCKKCDEHAPKDERP